jgi:hypothetical protein
MRQENIIRVFFRKFLEIFESQGAPPVQVATGIMRAAANFPTSTAGLVDTGGKFVPLNMEFDCQSLFELRMHSCTH